MSNLEYKSFSQIDLSDTFFSSLKEDYCEFEDWYNRKSATGHCAYTCDWENSLSGFLYLKVEDDSVDDIVPPLPAMRRLKVGTFKVDAHGTRLGERFVKTILDNAVTRAIQEVYVTVFQKHQGLINLLTQFGFYFHGTKTTHNGIEQVYIKRLTSCSGNSILDYPLMWDNGANKFALSIFPQFHSRMFPDSILNNESFDILEDVSHTNSIHKVYICAMQGVTDFRPGDFVFIYRTKDNNGPARYRSVITSVCVVQEIRNITSFPTLDEFLQYCRAYSIFSDEELISFYDRKRYPFIIKMTYNAAFNKRVTKGDLEDNHGIQPNYWGVFRLTDTQFYNVLRAGEVNESIIVN